MKLTYKPIYTAKDDTARQFIEDVINKYLDGRSKAIRDDLEAVRECIASLFALQGATRFTVHRRLMKPEQARAWTVVSKGLQGFLLLRESGRSDYSIKQGFIPEDVIVINNTQRGVNYRIEGKGVQWNNLSDMEPSLVSMICGVRSAAVELTTVDQTFEYLLQGKKLPVRWTYNTDLSELPISEDAVALADEYALWLNAYLERHGYIIGVKRIDNGMVLVCANDVVPNIQDILANISLRFFQQKHIPQVSFPLHIMCGGLTSFLPGQPLTQLRMEFAS